MKYLLQVALAGFSCLAGLGTAMAEPIKIVCAGEDTLQQGWTGPLTIIYSGGEAGEVTIASEHLAFTAPANLRQSKETAGGVEMNLVSISGAVEAGMAMPDPEALRACIAENIAPEFKDDADVTFVTLLSCLPKTPNAASPQLAHGNVRIGLISETGQAVPDVIVEISRRYIGETLANGEAIKFDHFPRDCTLAGG